MKFAKIVVAAVVVTALVLSGILIAGPGGVQAGATGINWVKSTSELTLDTGSLVGDAWVIKDDTTYKMWYSRLRDEATLQEIADRVDVLDPKSLVSSFLSLDFTAMWNQAAGLSSADIAAVVNSATPVIGYAESTDGVTWTVINNEVLSDGTGIQNGIGMPSVVKDGGTYRMWYTRVDSSLTQAQLTTLLADLGTPGATRIAAIESLIDSTSTVIGYAVSGDGVTWAVQNDAVLTGGAAGALDSVGAPSVILDGSTYKMWYSQIDSDLTPAEWAAELDDTSSYNVLEFLTWLDGTTTNIGYATSTDDGVTWIVGDADVVPGSTSLWNSVGDPSVIKDGSEYHMWYTRAKTDLGRGDIAGLFDTLVFDLGELNALYDLLSPLDVSGFISGFLAMSPVSTVEALLGATGTVIAYATSTDGTTWVVQDTDDLVGETGGTWSSVAAPTVIGTSGSFEMWFTEGVDAATEPNFSAVIDYVDVPIGYASETTGASVEVSVGLQGSRTTPEQWQIPLTVNFFTPGADVMVDTPVYTSSQTASQSASTAVITVAAIAPGTYDVTAQSENTLMNRQLNVVIAAPSTAVDMGTLLQGDVALPANDLVNFFDFSAMLPSYLKSTGDPAFNALADHDRNGLVNFFDFSMMLPNYLTSSPVDVP